MVREVGDGMAKISKNEVTIAIFGFTLTPVIPRSLMQRV